MGEDATCRSGKCPQHFFALGHGLDLTERIRERQGRESSAVQPPRTWCTRMHTLCDASITSVGSSLMSHLVMWWCVHTVALWCLFGDFIGSVA